jgi:AcrR family transcriptional regulator
MIEKTKPRRAPSQGGYARGAEQRLRIVEAALLVFGEQGYERASTRQIAQEAGVNPPALQYYFDGKEGLYNACLEHIAEQFYAALQPAFAVAASVAPAGRQEAVAALCGIFDALADFLFGSAQMDSWSRFIARGQADGGGCAGQPEIKRKIASTLHLTCGRLVGIAAGLPEDDPYTVMRAISLLGQIGIFHLGREGTLASLGWTDLRGDRLRALKAIVREQTEAILRPRD